MISLVGWSPIWQEPKLDVRNVSVGNAIGTAGNDWQRSPEPVKNEESRRCEFLKRFVALSTEADELKSFLARLRGRMPACPSGELARMTEWTEARLQRLEDELTPEGIAAALQERELFPEIDQLSDVRIATENDP